jgi:acetoacetate decarboxylase
MVSQSLRRSARMDRPRPAPSGAHVNLVPHVNAPVADLPVHRIVGAHHFLADLTLPYGRVVYDYNAHNFVAP